MSLGVAFPFNESVQGGVFATTQTTAQAIRVNLLSLLTTKRGHRVMNSRFYSPLYDYIFEPWDAISETELDKEMKEKILEFIPEINLENVIYDFDEEINLLKVNVIYRITDLGNRRDEISLTIDIQNEN